MHTRHEGTYRALADGCDACDDLARGELFWIDPDSLRALADLGAELKQNHNGMFRRELCSANDYTALKRLRDQARMVFASGITEEVAR